MTAPYIANTPSDQKAMLGAIGVSSLKDLFKGIPAKFILKDKLDLPDAISEFELKDYFEEMLGDDAVRLRRRTFLGAGVYDHFSPSIVNHLTLRGEFLTAYTPYQPEVSQGTLQVLHEFQTMVASLMGMDVATASHYDGATALADGTLMALRVGKKTDRIVVCPGLHPDYLATMKTFVGAQNIEIVSVGQDKASGGTDLADLQRVLDGADEGACVVISQSPNYFGIVDQTAEIGKRVKARAGIFVTATAEAMSLAILKSPGECGADIATGEGQSFGLAQSFGGPFVGLLTSRGEHMRQLPGRLCGLSKDNEGRDAFTLTLSTREQHIRRQKATSNICSNQNLCGVAVAIYLSLVGKRGLKELAIQNLSLAGYLREQAKTLPGVKFPYSGKTFNEFVLRLPMPAEDLCQAGLDEHGMIVGVPLTGVGQPNDLLVAVTETKAKDDLDAWTAAMNALLA